MITLVLGGTRSGKSQIAERLAAGLPAPVTYVATGSATDDEMAARIAAHRERRPASWSTVEVGVAGDLAATLRGTVGTVLVDSLGTWIAGRPDAGADEFDKVADALRARPGDAVVVSEEVGMSVHPLTDAGRLFVDALGALNQVVAGVADDVVLAVAGRGVRLEAIE